MKGYKPITYISLLTYDLIRKLQQRLYGENILGFTCWLLCRMYQRLLGCSSRRSSSLMLRSTGILKSYSDFSVLNRGTTLCQQGWYLKNSKKKKPHEYRVCYGLRKMTKRHWWKAFPSGSGWESLKQWLYPWVFVTQGLPWASLSNLHFYMYTQFHNLNTAVPLHCFRYFNPLH